MKHLITLLLVFFFLPIYSQTQIGLDIDGEAAGDYSGVTAISADGRRVAIGAEGNNGNGFDSGHVRVYEENGGSWIQIGNDIDGEDYGSGASVAISADGKRVAIGAPRNSGTAYAAGHARIYEENGGSWTQIGSDIDGEDGADYFGFSVSISSDGKRVAIGGPSHGVIGNSPGHVKIYEETGGSWTQIGSDIDGETHNDNSGGAVSLSSDGNRVVIGASFNSGNGQNSGHARVYELNNGTWTQLGNDIDGEAAGDRSGRAVSISSDGKRVAVGGFLNDGNGTNSGHTRIYEENGGVWTQIGNDIDGEAADDFSGRSVSLSSDGKRVAIGAYLNDGSGPDSGHARIYEENGGVWTQLMNDIDGEAAGDLSGIELTLSSDGERVAIGATNNDENGTSSGHVRVYQLSPISNIQEKNMLANLTISPNPNTGAFQLEVAGKPTEKLELQVSNTLGTVMYERTLKFSSGNLITDVDLGAVPSGTYILEVQNGEQKTYKKLSVIN